MKAGMMTVCPRLEIGNSSATPWMIPITIACRNVMSTTLRVHLGRPDAGAPTRRERDRPYARAARTRRMATRSGAAGSVDAERLHLVVGQGGEDRLGERPGRRRIELDGDTLGRVRSAGPEVDAEGVLDRRLLGVVEVHDRLGDREP